MVVGCQLCEPSQEFKHTSQGYKHESKPRESFSFAYHSILVALQRKQVSKFSDRTSHTLHLDEPAGHIHNHEHCNSLTGDEQDAHNA